MGTNAVQEKSLVEKAAEFLTASITRELNLGKKVLFIVPGGSAIAVAVAVSKLLEKVPHQNLTVTLTDERYGPIGHADSNWQELSEKGFNLSGAKLIPVLIGENVSSTTQKFKQVINEELLKNSYKIGLFGIGPDGHTAGILPGSKAVDFSDLAYTYKTPTFERITITPKTIEKLDEVVVYAKGKEKWKVLAELETEKDIHEQPAQILKKVPKLKIFTDYPNQK